jgi:hypothetical protein
VHLRENNGRSVLIASGNDCNGVCCVLTRSRSMTFLANERPLNSASDATTMEVFHLLQEAFPPATSN